MIPRIKFLRFGYAELKVLRFGFAFLLRTSAIQASLIALGLASVLRDKIKTYPLSKFPFVEQQTGF